MYRNKIIGVVVPAYNEETLLEQMTGTIPTYVDHIIIVDDGSTDATPDIMRRMAHDDQRVVCLFHTANLGVGAAVASGYRWCREHRIEISVVMNSDCQMNPNDLPNLLDPVVDNLTDYAKGNRLVSGEAWNKIPHIRYMGNSILTLLTKIVSGYWHVTDSQSGYTAINLKALDLLPIDRIYRGYGVPNDILVRLNILGMRVVDIPVTPIYGVGEKSNIKIYKVIFTIPFLLMRGFLRRMFQKHIIRDFHPLVFFYLFGIFILFVDILFLGRLIWVWIKTSHIPTMNALFVLLCTLSGFQFVLFAMLFDMEANKDLKGKRVENPY
jgi:glycosyltransferase involved in cell wall biosynthesis